MSCLAAGTWTITVPAVDGDLVRYKYVRTVPIAVDEVTSDHQPVAYRLLAAGGARVTAEDTVATWSDTPFAGELGQISGRAAIWHRFDATESIDLE